MARPNTCCTPAVCGYTFVDASNPNQPGSQWQLRESRWLLQDDGSTVILDMLKDGRVGGLEFV
jgi:hypothetical protein